MVSGAAVGLAADGHAVAGVKVVVERCSCRRWGRARLDGHVVVAGPDIAVGDGDVGGSPGSMPSVLRAFLGCVDLTAQTVRPSPRWKEMWKLGRVFEGDAVECEVVGEVGVDKVVTLLAACGAGVFGDVARPGLVGGMAVEEDFGAALSVDGAVAHDGGAGGAACGDQRAASGGGVVDQAAGAFGELVVIRIARGVESDAAVDEQGDAGAQRDRAGEECGVCSIGGEFDGVGFWRSGRGPAGCGRCRGVTLLLARDSISPLVADAVVRAAFSVTQAGGMTGSVTLRVSCARREVQAIAAAVRITANPEGFMLLHFDRRRWAQGLPEEPGRASHRPRSFYLRAQGVGYCKRRIECDLRCRSYNGRLRLI